MFELEHLAFFAPSLFKSDGELQLLINILSNTFTIILTATDFVVIFFFNKKIRNQIFNIILLHNSKNLFVFKNKKKMEVTLYTTNQNLKPTT